MLISLRRHTERQRDRQMEGKEPESVPPPGESACLLQSLVLLPDLPQVTEGPHSCLPLPFPCWLQARAVSFVSSAAPDPQGPYLCRLTSPGAGSSARSPGFAHAPRAQLRGGPSQEIICKKNGFMGGFYGHTNTHAYYHS